MIPLDPAPNLIDQVYARILEAITDRTLLPGQRVGLVLSPDDGAAVAARVVVRFHLRAFVRVGREPNALYASVDSNTMPATLSPSRSTRLPTGR